MYLTCPECYTSFVIKPEQIGPKGRRVRCSRCSHGWFAPAATSGFTGDAPKFQILKSDKASKHKEQFNPGVNLPALLPTNIPFYLYLAPILLAIAIFFSSAIFFVEKFPFLSLTSAHRELKVKDIHIAYDRDYGNIIAKYKILNKSKGSLSLPSIRIRLLDANHRILKSHVASEASSSLAPKQFVSMRTRFSEAPSNVEYIDITLGNKLDLLLR